MYSPHVIIASTEPKAAETAQIVAAILNLPLHAAEALHEHDRTGTGWLDTAQFESKIAAFFDQPETLVMGHETADQAHSRFANAIRSLVETHASKNIAVVSHATVMTLFASRALGIEPFSFWKRLGLPSFVVLTIPDARLVELVENVDSK